MNANSRKIKYNYCKQTFRPFGLLQCYIEISFFFFSDKFSIAVPQQEVINLIGFPSLCVLIVPNALPGLTFSLIIHALMLSLISPFSNHLLHHSVITCEFSKLGSDVS